VLFRPLGVSERRALLDERLQELTASLRGVVLDIGGRRTIRGSFTPPVDRCRMWIRLNLDPAAAPDVRGDAAALPLRDGVADAVLCCETLQYVELPETVVQEFNRVLRPEGQLVLSAPFLHRADTTADRHRFTALGLAELARSAGFEVVSVSQQGLFFTTLGHFLRQAASYIPPRSVRIVAAAVVIPLVAVLRRFDRMSVVRRSTFLSSFATGFVLVARKP
jgi:SAM-dependent methyltransferase